LLAQGLLGIPEFNLRDSGVSPRGSEAPGLNFQSVRVKEESVKSQGTHRQSSLNE
jgi:hypothetical protein